MTTKTYTVAHTRDSLIAIVPDGGDIQGAIDAELENYVVPEQLDPDDIQWSGHETGVISDENGTHYDYIVKR